MGELSEHFRSFFIGGMNKAHKKGNIYRFSQAEIYVNYLNIAWNEDKIKKSPHHYRQYHRQENKIIP